MTKKVDFDRFAKEYNQLLNKRTSFFSENEIYFAKYKVDIVRRHVQFPVCRLLEFGCGIGRNIPFLQKAFPTATIMGSDISAGSLDIAKRDNAGAEFFIENENMQSALKFDLIFVAGVFHHIPVARRFNVAKILRKRLAIGGAMFVFEHNPYNPVTRRIVNNCEYDEDAILVKPSRLKRILSKAAFKVERTEYCLFVPPRMSMMRNFENIFGWVPLGGQYWIKAMCGK